MLTRRGWAFVGIAVGAFLMAGWFSARSLNAVAAPAAVALAAGYLQRKRASQPELRTQTPEYGFAGETATVSLRFDASIPLAATVRLGVDEGLRIEDDEVETTVADGSVTFEIELEDRGFQSVGPVEVVAEDVFGVWETVYTYPVNTEVVVFPKIHRLDDAGDLAVLHRDFGLGGRDRFDQLREYERGDPLRDVHWKSSAKRPDEDLVVMEFEASEEREQIELLAEAEGGRMDDVAEAAASVATYLLESGLAVGLTVPGGRLDPSAGPEHRTDLLTLLASTYPGSVGDARREGMDVLVQGEADEDTVQVTIGDRTVTFDQLSGTSPGGAEQSGRPTSARDGGNALADGEGGKAVSDGGMAVFDGSEAVSDGGEAVSDDDESVSNRGDPR
jgi:uncharacterized protein (DUF58 family)